MRQILKSNYSRLKPVVLAVFFGALCSGCKPTQAPVSGLWLGTFEWEPYPEVVQLNVDSALIVKAYYSQVEPHIPEEFSNQNGKLSFKTDKELFDVVFNGQVSRDGKQVTGVVETGGQSYPGTLQKLRPNSLEEVSGLIGFYQEPVSGDILLATPYVIDQQFANLSILDYGTGLKRTAFPIEGGYQIGPKMMTPAPSVFTLTNAQPDSAYADTLLANRDGVLQRLIRLNDLNNYEDIEVANGPITLATTITFPLDPAEDKVPLVIYVPGSGEQFRGNLFQDYFQQLPYWGFATLIYDKRGVGESTGDLQNSSIEDFGEDLNAIIQAYKNHPRVDNSRIFLLGQGQAGYVMSVAISKNQDLAGAIFLSSPTVSLTAHELQATALRMAADDFDEAQIDEALTYQAFFFEYLAGQHSDQLFKEKGKLVEGKAYSSYLTLPNNTNYIDWWKTRYTFNPQNYLSDNQVPFLALYGENDLLVPTPQNADLFRMQLKREEHLGSEVKILTGANHLLMLGESRGDIQLTEIIGYHPELFSTMKNWLFQRKI